ncbi:TetR/AcrR family transcriptional regulator [Demequina sp. NBRC 110057]|uniref:TetR/AcrR family transcriptional regulator n=1 Tax=Demequina sp. NBRC 110057 TaxID=1570346 RepID=UPI000A02EE29|nr:TetR/AcrR family transcriptional regulator [Demequina sp. NBRC 110057]
MADEGAGAEVRRRGPNSSTPARRAQLARAALESFAEHGYERASLRDIAARAGVTHAAVLRHYADKDELLVAALELRDQEDAAVSERLQDAHATRSEIIDAIFRQEFADPGLQRNWLALTIAATHPDHPAHDFFVRRRERMRANFRDTVLVGTGEEVLTASDKVTLLQALVDGARIQSLLDPERDVLHLVEVVLGLVAGPSD